MPTSKQYIHFIYFIISLERFSLLPAVASFESISRSNIICPLLHLKNKGTEG